jgi:hypothetical protein
VAQSEVRKAMEQLESLQLSIQNLIQGLWWKDFELLVDLIFTQSGWQRLSVLGQTDKNIDLDPSREIGLDEMYFVVHTCDLTMRNRTETGVNILDLEKLSKLVVNAGLINWLITKRS